MTDQLGKETDAAERDQRRDLDDDAEVKQLLDQFARAVTSGDGRAIARLWDSPALVVSDEAVRSVASLGEVEQFFSGAKDQYNRLGIVDTRADVTRLDWATDRIAVVRVRWPWLDAEGRENGEETSTYVLRRDDAGNLKVRAVIMHGAAPKH
jgi:ketosteroid isomerase-like protein